ncbi:amino acid racemase [Wukongibacter baidiensis]|uniref:aspartate/glutamate racemase family protein n=1 Tax=Wukongibacter baidiensis TaxID=1723361 RepID=UPI003D7FA034
MKTIGILAGMGPRSTSPFLELVLNQCQQQYGAKNDIDFPHILIYSLPTPFYIDREIDDNALRKSIEDGVKRFESCGVDFIAIPCNSAHKYFDSLVKVANVPILNIIEETLKNIEGSSTVTIFATETTISSGLYQAGLDDSGCKYYFDSSWQKRVNEIIKMIKANSDIDNVREKWDSLIEQVVDSGIDTVIIACTDLNVVLSDKERVKIVDSSESLAAAVVKKYLE